jgi:predicted methyltransferase
MRFSCAALLLLGVGALQMPAVADTGTDLAELLAAQPAEVQARYPYRHPQATLEFFGVQPGMTVLEGLPGGGWYTKLLLPYLGEEGTIIAADYAMNMWPLFPFGTEQFVAKRANWLTEFTAMTDDWRSDASAKVTTMRFGSLPKELAGTADVVFFARVLHNLANFEAEGGFLTQAIADAYAALKPGGVFGVVQHEARVEMPDEWADGSRGYLKKVFVIEHAEKAGFVFEADSDINANDADQPGLEDVVWRLPPSYRGSSGDAESKAKLDAIGESNRMTLRFRKPD